LRGNRNDRFNGGDCVDVILGSSLSRSPLSDRATIGAIDVKALVERIIKVESSGIPNAQNKLSSASGAGQFPKVSGKASTAAQDQATAFPAWLPLEPLLQVRM
jgi:hypothetical protein